MSEAAVNIFVHGNPLPKQSFVYTEKGGGYTRHEVKDWQDRVSWKAQEAMIDRDMIEAAVEVEIIFWRKSKARVDLDNLSKAILDALKGIVFTDDCQVTSLILKKCFDKTNPGCRIRIAPAKEEQ